MFLAMETRLLGHIDHRIEAAQGPPATQTTADIPLPTSSGPRVFVGTHPRSSRNTDEEEARLQAELQTVLPDTPPMDPTLVEVKQEKDSDIEIISTPPPSPPRPSRIAQAAAGIDQAKCRLHVRQACQVLGKAPGTLPDTAQESAHASALTSLRHFRDHGMLPTPEVKVAWPHDESLDHTQGLFTASLQQVEGSKPARDLFAIPPPPKTADRFLPLPTRKIPRDQWFYMSQTAPESTWNAKAPKDSVLDTGTLTPNHYILPSSQFLAQESNLRHLSHLATMTNNASLAVCEVLFHMFDSGLWPTEPITMPGVPEPISFEWFLSMAQLMGASTSQTAHNAVCAAMNLQLLRRDVFLNLSGAATGLSPADRERMRVAPMDSDDLFGSQAAHLSDRKALYEQFRQQPRQQRNFAVANRVGRTPGRTASPPHTPGQQPRSRSSSRSRRRNRQRSTASASASRPPPASPPAQQPFRGNSSRGRGGGNGGGSNQASRGRGGSARTSGSGSANRGRSRQGPQ